MPLVFHSGFETTDGTQWKTSHWEPDKYEKLGRDYQRKREYRSEWAFAKEQPEDGMSKPELRTYLNTVARDQWFRDRFGTVLFAVEISRRRKTRASCCRRGVTFTLKFPELGGNNTRLLALHELAHILCYDQSHGPIYCSVLLQVVTHFMGAVAGKELRRQFGINMVELVR